MIRSIRLSNWRAYEDLELPLTRPVTFFVAPNGVGKTSLVEAVRWALLGLPDDKLQGRAVRGGHNQATVSLSLHFPGVDDVKVTRTLKRSGTTTFAATLGQRAIDEAEYGRILREACAADRGLLDALIFGPALSSKATTSEFPIRDHLARAFGVDSLLATVQRMKARRDEIAMRMKALRADLSGTQQVIEQAEARVAELEQEEVVVSAEREAAEMEVEELRVAAALSSAWDKYRRDLVTYEQRIRDIARDMSNLISVPEEDPRTAIAEAEREAESDIEAATEERAEAEISSARASSSSELLEQATDRCPTCLRPLTEEERLAALAEHGDAVRNESSRLHQLAQRSQQARERLQALREYSGILQRLRAPASPDQPDPGPGVLQALSERQHRLALLTERHGAVRARLDAAREELSSFQRAVSEQGELLDLSREDLLLEVTQRALNSVADRYVAARIEPLTNEVGRRWKLVFGTEGLNLASDGGLTLRHGDLDVALREMSGGERATAILVTRLLLAGSATRASAVWLDEPLEHLDPRRRAAVAQAIVAAAQADTVRQILVTTYEEGLARRLAITAPDDVELVYAYTDTGAAPAS